MLGLIRQKNWQEAEHVILNHLTIFDNKTTFFTPDTLLNYVLNQKQAEAEQAGIPLDINCLLPSKTTLKSEIISIIIGNLLDNAIAACSRLTPTNDKQISLSIRFFDHSLTIAIENTFNPSEKTSRKKRRREGLGIKNIKKAVSENKGLYQQESRGERYYVFIIFPTLSLVLDENTP